MTQTPSLSELGHAMDELDGYPSISTQALIFNLISSYYKVHLIKMCVGRVLNVSGGSKKINNYKFQMNKNTYKFIHCIQLHIIR